MYKNIYAWVIIIGLTGSCGKLNTELEQCQPLEGHFINGTHYVSSEFITEDRTWNYQKLHTYREKKADFYPNEGCLNAAQPVTLEETLRAESESIDFRRSKRRIVPLDD
ncbi:MAG: hypothetical protein ABUK01_15235 [Leptospirales bacterium]